MEFRLLRADEIDCRIASCSGYGVQLLLYKDARCDQNILDETVGPMNWQRKHTRDNANCIVSIWDNDKKMWVEKEDTGKESFTEAEKGLASDSFKRACFNWGIGRELYTAPRMFVGKDALKTLEKDERGKWTCKDYFSVTDIRYDGKRIAFVETVNEKTGQKIAFGTTPAEEKVKKQNISAAKVAALVSKCEKEGVSVDKILELYKINSLEDMTEKAYKNCVDNFERIKEM